MAQGPGFHVWHIWNSSQFSRSILFTLLLQIPPQHSQTLPRTVKILDLDLDLGVAWPSLRLANRTMETESNPKVVWPGDATGICTIQVTDVRDAPFQPRSCLTKSPLN